MVAVGDAATYIAWDINNSGQMACLEDPSPYLYSHPALCGPSPATVAVLALGSPNSSTNGPLAINDLGWIAGSTDKTGGFLWTPGGMTIFGTSFTPVDLNDAGEVIGYYSGQPAVWTAAGGYQTLPGGTFDGQQLFLTGINDSGQIVGYYAATPEPGTLPLTLSCVLLVPILLKVRDRLRQSCAPSGLLIAQGLVFCQKHFKGRHFRHVDRVHARLSAI